MEQATGAPDASYPVKEDIRYLVAVLADNEAIACGGLQTLGPDTAEIKRMYVVPAHRGRGVSRQILLALEDLAGRSGQLILRVETGTYLPAAIHLYESAGYRPIPLFGPYVGNSHSVCFEKVLTRL